MNISNVGQTISPGIPQSGKNIPPQTVNKAIDSIGDTNSPPKTVDMRNVSLNEINTLIRSGVEGLLDVIPFVPPNIINQKGAEYAANIKIDFLGQVEGIIEYNKSIGKDITFSQKILENLKNIDGMKLPLKINVVA
ncbi:MAG: hypothetical protein GXP17_01930 [Gammaproteobacteria bacterium]|nr:hypothetical protein [Gammaproteobacteria bacterium]